MIGSGEGIILGTVVVALSRRLLIGTRVRLPPIIVVAAEDIVVVVAAGRIRVLVAEGITTAVVGAAAADRWVQIDVVILTAGLGLIPGVAVLDLLKAVLDIIQIDLIAAVIIAGATFAALATATTFTAFAA